MFHVPRQRKSLSLALPAPGVKYTPPRTHGCTHAHTLPPFAFSFSPACSLSLPTRERALGSLVRCSRGGCVSRGSMRDQWLALTNSQRAPLISWLRDQNLRERGERGGRKRKRNCAGERTFTHQEAHIHRDIFTRTHTDARTHAVCRSTLIYRTSKQIMIIIMMINMYFINPRVEIHSLHLTHPTRNQLRLPCLWAGQEG